MRSSRSDPNTRTWPAVPTRTGTPAAAASRRTSADPNAGSSSGLTRISATAWPDSTPASPSTWSAWKCVSTSSGTRRTRSRSRQASTFEASGPVSTITAEPGPTGNARASPCPTSHATTTQPCGGQPAGPTTCAPPSTRTMPPTTEPMTRRRRISSGPSVIAASTGTSTSRPPAGPDRHGRTAHGRSALVRATQTTQSAGQPATVPAIAAAGCETSASSVADSPRIVVTGTAGAAARLAASDTRLT